MAQQSACHTNTESAALDLCKIGTWQHILCPVLPRGPRTGTRLGLTGQHPSQIDELQVQGKPCSEKQSEEELRQASSVNLASMCTYHAQIFLCLQETFIPFRLLTQCQHLPEACLLTYPVTKYYLKSPVSRCPHYVLFTLNSALVWNFVFCCQFGDLILRLLQPQAFIHSLCSQNNYCETQLFMNQCLGHGLVLFPSSL